LHITLYYCALIDVCSSWIFKGSSKGFGFAQFTSVDHARAFVDPLFPFIQIPPPASHGASAATAFYKALETGIPHNGRRVKIDYSQSASHHDRRFNRASTNDGTRDIGTTQAPILLFRGLDPLSGPQAIYQAMLYSSGPNQQGAKGMKRIILIKDKVTMASFGFAFVEFVDVQVLYSWHPNFSSIILTLTNDSVCFDCACCYDVTSSASKWLSNI
jgi:RNA recognition motif-containing protein